jgi:hypothetical protein
MGCVAATARDAWVRRRDGSNSFDLTAANERPPGGDGSHKRGIAG